LWSTSIPSAIFDAQARRLKWSSRCLFPTLGIQNLARDELGLSDIHLARRIQAAIASALAFAAGAALPLGVAVAAPLAQLGVFVTVASLASLAVLGAVAARTGGATVLKGSLRVALWGAVAMALTALVGRAFGTVL
jgi:VIT1/CCC1 family predicted Fe2+/Mn2+ transporter